MPRGTPIVYMPEDQRSRLIGKGLGEGFAGFVKGAAERAREDRLTKFRREMEEARKKHEKSMATTAHARNVEVLNLQQKFKKENMMILKDFDMEKIEHQALQDAKKQVAVAKAKGEITRENEASALQLAHQLSKSRMIQKILAQEDSTKRLTTHKHLLTEDAAEKQREHEKVIAKEGITSREKIAAEGEAGETKRLQMKIDAQQAIEKLRVELKTAEGAEGVTKSLLSALTGLEGIEFESDEEKARALARVASIGKQWGIEVPMLLEEAKKAGAGEAVIGWLDKVVKGGLKGGLMLPGAIVPPVEMLIEPEGEEDIVWDLD